MNISSWPLGKIMQLPEHCFGRKFIVSMTAYSVLGAPAWDIAEIALPEKCVIWGLSTMVNPQEYQIETFRLALGHTLPATVAAMNELEPIINGLGMQGAGPRSMYQSRYIAYNIQHMKQVIESGGRKAILELTALTETDARMTVAMVVSSIPREAPEWLISGSDKNLL